MISLNNDQLIAATHSRIEFAKMMLSDNPEPLKERTWAIELRLAGIALAALTTEPVYQLINYDWYDTTEDVYESVVSAGGRGRIVYASPPAPVVPDGYALVPVEPTEGMVIAGFEAELREQIRDPEAWEAFEAMSGCEQAAQCAKWCWAAMVKAATQQEVK